MLSDPQALDSLVIQVRADTSGFQSGIGDIRRQLDGSLVDGADRAGALIARSLTRATTSGRSGFEDLGKTALKVLADIAASAVTGNLGRLVGGGGDASPAASFAGLFGVSGRAIGGQVSPGRPYLVGERGPELFVPTSAGGIATGGAARGAVNVTVNVAAAGDTSPATMQRTGAQVARALRRVLEQADR